MQKCKNVLFLLQIFLNYSNILNSFNPRSLRCYQMKSFFKFKNSLFIFDLEYVWMYKFLFSIISMQKWNGRKNMVSTFKVLNFAAIFSLSKYSRISKNVICDMSRTRPTVKLTFHQNFCFRIQSNLRPSNPIDLNLNF